MRATPDLETTPTDTLGAVNLNLEQRLKTFLNEHRNVPAVGIVILDSQGQEIAAGAAGVSRPDDPLSSSFTVDTPLRIASNTKTYVAATILRLTESGHLDLDAPLTGYLSPALQAQLQDGDYSPSQMSLRQLLVHSSGIFDYAATNDFLAKVLAEPQRVWTREDQVQLAIDIGEPIAAPGDEFHYSDTGYLILGHVIEQLTNRSLASVVREALHFDQLGLTTTWWELIESPPRGAPARAHQFINGLDIHDFHPSLDLYGGGGLIASVRDLAVFHAALFKGDVLENAATLDEMMDGAGSADPSQSRLGLQISYVDGHEAFGHNGFWGTAVRHIPKTGLTIAGVVTEQEGFDALLRLILELASSVANQRVSSPPEPPRSP